MASQNEHRRHVSTFDSSQRIAVLLPLSTHWSDQLMRGIAAYARRKKSWAYQWFGPGPEAANSVRNWKPHGMVAFFDGEQPPPRFLQITSRIVAVNSSFAIPGIPSVSVDRHAVGQKAAEHFSRRGVTNYACLTHQRPESDACCQGYADFARLHQHCNSLVYCAKKPSASNAASLSPDSKFRAWLKAAPKPLGLFAVSDRLAREACQVCRELGIRVPQDVAILGAGDDETVCQTCGPSLSSVRNPLPQVGFEAARMLDGLLAGRRLEPSHLLLRPIGVTVRRSCDVCDVDDAEIAQVLRLIYGSTGQPLGMKELLNRITMSRRTLEQRFQAVTGRSPAAEVRRVGLQRAVRLFVESDVSITQIARTCGFSNPTTFRDAFSRHRAMSPSEFRNRYGRASGAAPGAA